LQSSEAAPRSQLRSRETASHPFARRARARLRRRTSRRAVLPRARLGLPRGSPRRRGEDASHRPLQPTHDTCTREPLDFRARAPLGRVPTTGNVLDRDRVLPRGVGPPFGKPTPAGCALDGTPPASALCASALSAVRGRLRAPPIGRRLPDTALSAVRKAGEGPLALPVAPRVAARVNPGAHEEPGPFPPPPRQGGRLPRPEAPFIDKVLSRGPLSRFARLVRARHRYRGFATDDPASDAASPLATLSRGGARPIS
jgi:hypothetical protein